MDHTVYLQVLFTDAHPQHHFAALRYNQRKSKVFGDLIFAQAPAQLFGGQALQGFGFQRLGLRLRLRHINMP